MQTNPAVEQDRNIKCPESPWNQSGKKGKRSMEERICEEPSLRQILFSIDAIRYGV